MPNQCVHIFIEAAFAYHRKHTKTIHRLRAPEPRVFAMYKSTINNTLAFRYHLSIPSNIQRAASQISLTLVCYKQIFCLKSFLFI